MLPAESRHPGAEFRRSLSVAACFCFATRKANYGLQVHAKYNNSTYFFVSFFFVSCFVSLCLCANMLHAASLFPRSNPPSFFFCNRPCPTQAVGRVDVAHRRGRHSAAQASDRARGRNVLHHPRFRRSPGNGVRRKGPIDKTYRAHIVERHRRWLVFQKEIDVIGRGSVERRAGRLHTPCNGSRCCRGCSGASLQKVSFYIHFSFPAFCVSDCSSWHSSDCSRWKKAATLWRAHPLVPGTAHKRPGFP